MTCHPQCEALRQSLLMRYYDRSQPRNRQDNQADRGVTGPGATYINQANLSLYDVQVSDTYTTLTVL